MEVWELETCNWTRHRSDWLMVAASQTRPVQACIMTLAECTSHWWTSVSWLCWSFLPGWYEQVMFVPFWVAGFIFCKPLLWALATIVQFTYYDTLVGWGSPLIWHHFPCNWSADEWDLRWMKLGLLETHSQQSSQCLWVGSITTHPLQGLRVSQQ